METVIFFYIFQYIIRRTFTTNSPQGDGNNMDYFCPISVATFFHHQFPARGWKQLTIHHLTNFAGFPFTTNSPQGDGNIYMNTTYLENLKILSPPIPREGMETFRQPQRIDLKDSFTTNSPQGDGNLSKRLLIHPFT